MPYSTLPKCSTLGEKGKNIYTDIMQNIHWNSRRVPWIAAPRQCKLSELQAQRQLRQLKHIQQMSWRPMLVLCLQVWHDWTPADCRGDPIDTVTCIDCRVLILGNRTRFKYRPMTSILGKRDLRNHTLCGVKFWRLQFACLRSSAQNASIAWRRWYRFSNSRPVT